ncbi:MAG: hypothetical protein A3K10_14040 [Bacteroidetes bacterium RIFCSPLOWO2_12_FULL_31_6]|nr:MAG: hypothetical protein A3K10_14040 [Bacteroidetes bacterium RIFCSPLOWO2_12_FULL_31_6]
MKKLYTRFFALGLIVATSFTVFAQTDEQISTKTFSSDEIQAVLKQTQPGNVVSPNVGQSIMAICTNVLNAPAAGGNSFDGNMFDITATNNVTIETFAVTTDLPATIEIYARTGTFVGFTTSSTGWTLVGSGSITGAGVGVPVEVPVDIAYPMSSGSTHAFYVTANAAGTTFSYTNGTTVGNTWASDANITLKEGNGGGYPFSVTFSPRNFNGNVIYCLPVGVTETLQSNNVSIYPNPTSDVLNISLPLTGLTTDLSVYNVIGEVVLKEQLIANGTTNQLDISNLNAGVYFVKLQAKGFEYSTKLFVE